MRRSELGHDIDVTMGGQRLGNEPHDIFRPCQAMGHDQVTDEKASLRYPVGVNLQVPDLTMHLSQDGFNHVWIVRSIAESPCHL